jgi:hypothetical protein
MTTETTPSGESAVNYGEWVRWFLTMAAIIVTLFSANTAREAGKDAERAANTTANYALQRDLDLTREAHVRERDLCGVVIDVHRNAKFRYTTEKRQLRQTLSYLRSQDSRELPALRERIVQNLPQVRAQVVQAKRNVDATKPPPTCKPYVDISTEG